MTFHLGLTIGSPFCVNKLSSIQATRSDLDLLTPMDPDLLRALRAETLFVNPGMSHDLITPMVHV